MFLTLQVLPGMFSVCRLDPVASIPSWALSGAFFSITHTDNEVSIVCLQEVVPAGIPCESGWRCLKVKGPLDFSLIGVLASLAVPLMEAGISLFAVSTFDTDYLLVRAERLEDAVEALRCAGHQIEP